MMCTEWMIWNTAPVQYSTVQYSTGLHQSPRYCSMSIVSIVCNVPHTLVWTLASWYVCGLFKGARLYLFGQYYICRYRFFALLLPYVFCMPRGRSVTGSTCRVTCCLNIACMWLLLQSTRMNSYTLVFLPVLTLAGIHARSYWCLHTPFITCLLTLLKWVWVWVSVLVCMPTYGLEFNYGAPLIPPTFL